MFDKKKKIANVATIKVAKKLNSMLESIADIAEAVNLMGPKPGVHNYLALATIGLSKYMKHKSNSIEDDPNLEFLVVGGLTQFVKKLCETSKHEFHKFGSGSETVEVCDIFGEFLVFTGQANDMLAYYRHDDENSRDRVLAAIGREAWERYGSSIELVIPPGKDAELVSWDIGEILTSNQTEALYERTKKFLDKGMARSVLLNGPPGCIAANMHVRFAKEDEFGKIYNHKGGSIENLYYNFNQIKKTPTSKLRKRAARYLATSMTDDGILRRNEIESVLYSGVKKCIKLTTVTGRELICTPDHPIATKNGYFNAEDLVVGSKVLTHQNVLWKKENKKKRIVRPEVYVKHHPTTCTKKIKQSSGIYTYKRLTRARAVFEANLNGIDLSSYIKLLNSGELDGLVFSNQNFDIHHIDEDPLNDIPENLMQISHQEHANEHKDYRMGMCIAIEDEISSIEDAGEHKTYDIRMKDSPHNFVTEDFVVHNTGKSCMAKAIASKNSWTKVFIDANQLAQVRQSNGIVKNLLAILKPQCIIIDDLDRASSNVSYILSLLDSIKGSCNLIIVSMNHMSLVDAAILRAGRFDEIEQVERVVTSKDLIPELSEEQAKELDKWPVAFLNELKNRVIVLGEEHLEEEIEKLQSRVNNNTKKPDKLSSSSPSYSDWDDWDD